MRTLTIPDLDPFEEENAQDYIHHASDSPDTKKFSAIYVEPLDDPFLSRGAARAFAARLLALADEWDRQESTGVAITTADLIRELSQLDPNTAVVLDMDNPQPDLTEMVAMLTRPAPCLVPESSTPLRRLRAVDDRFRDRDS